MNQVNGQSETLMKNYLNWFHQNGGYINGVQISEVQGLRGLRVTNPLNANKAVIAVPNKIVISTTLVSKSDLKQLLKAHPEQFDIEYNSEADYNKLAIFVFHEKLKCEKSFYHHFFAVTTNCSTILEWSEQDLDELQDPNMKQNGLQFQQQMLDHWQEIQSIIKKYPKLFPLHKDQEYKSLYYWCYQYVMTRIFQWGQPCAVLLPVAEFLNHQSSMRTSAQNYCFNRNFEEAPAMTNNKPYQQKHKDIDVTLIKSFGKQERPSTKFDDLRGEYIQNNLQYIEDLSPYSTESRKIDTINWKITEESNLQHIFNLQYYSTSNEEDNDTEQDYEYEEEEPVEKDKLSTEHGVNQINHRETNFTWYSHDDNDNYFLVVTKRQYSIGDQLCCSYGRRTSRYLLKWYGFCELQSKNDSYQFQLWIHQRKINNEGDAMNSVFRGFVNQKQEQSGILVGDQIISVKMLSQPYKLKSEMLNEDLLIYLRNIVSEQMNVKLKLMALPTDIDIEIQVFSKLDLILSVFKSDVIDDQQESIILSKLSTIEGRKQISTIYKLNRSCILKNQIKMVSMISAILLRLKDGVEFRQAYMMPILAKDQDELMPNSSKVQIRDYLRQLWVGIYGRK